MKLGFENTRIGAHINRLLSTNRSRVERNFALALVKWLQEKDKESTSLLRVLAGEGVDTTLAWTISPYLYNELDFGNETITRVLSWTLTGRHDSDEVYLRGMDWYNSFGANKTFTLSEYDTDMSHRFARLESQRLIAEGYV